MYPHPYTKHVYFSPWNSDNITLFFYIILEISEDWNTLESLLASQFEQTSVSKPFWALHQCREQWRLLFLVDMFI